MHTVKHFKLRANQVDEARQIDGGAQTNEAEIKSDQDQTLRRSNQKSGRFYESVTKLPGRKDCLHPRQ